MSTECGAGYLSGSLKKEIVNVKKKRVNENNKREFAERSSSSNFKEIIESTVFMLMYGKTNTIL